MMTNFHLNTTVVEIFPNVCLWRPSLCSDLVLTLKNRIKPPSYARTAYVVAIWPSFLFDSFVKICEVFLGKWFTAPPGKKFPVRLCLFTRVLELFHKRKCLNFHEMLSKKTHLQLEAEEDRNTHAVIGYVQRPIGKQEFRSATWVFMFKFKAQLRQNGCTVLATTKYN